MDGDDDVKVPPTICLTRPSWMSMHGRKRMTRIDGTDAVCVVDRDCPASFGGKKCERALKQVCGRVMVLGQGMLGTNVSAMSVCFNLCRGSSTQFDLKIKVSAQIKARTNFQLESFTTGGFQQDNAKFSMATV